MKNFLLTCGLVLGLLVGISQSGHAQNGPGQGNGNGPGWWNNNGNQYPGWVTNGNVPHWAAMIVLTKAWPTYQESFGLGYLQWLNKYQIGQVTIEIITTSPPTEVLFRVSYGGISISVGIDSF